MCKGLQLHGGGLRNVDYKNKNIVTDSNKSAICSHQSHQMPHFSAKMHQIQFRLGFHPRPRWGSLQRSPRPPSWWGGGYLPLSKNPTPALGPSGLDTSSPPAWKKFREYLPILTGKGFPLKLKGKVYATCVRSCLMYGSEIWSMKVEHVLKFDRTQFALKGVRLDGCVGLS